LTKLFLDTNENINKNDFEDLCQILHLDISNDNEKILGVSLANIFFNILTDKI
jgi:hypothetical protein